MTRLFLACVLLALCSAPAAAVDWLVLIVDRSNSIDLEELALQRRAYVEVLSDPDVQAAIGDGQVALIEFDRRAELVVDWTDPASAARRYARPRPEGLRGQTGIGEALERALTLLDGKPGHKVIDVSGDGPENVDKRHLRRMRQRAYRRSIDVNCLAILTDEEPQLDRYYMDQVSTNFVMSVDKGEDFRNALKRKLFIEVASLQRVVQ